MDDDSSQREEKVRGDTTTSESLNKTFVSTLVLAYLVTSLPTLIVSLLLIEISQSFGIEVGIAGQVRSIASIASVVMGLLMGGLSVRFNHKSLYIMGLVLLNISALCCYLAPTFMVLLVAFALFGFSVTIIRPMGDTLVTRFIPLQQRPKVASYQVVGMASAYLVGSSLVNVIGEWKLMFLVLLFPLALINLVLALKGIPSTPRDSSASQEVQQAFKDVLFNKSALTCLIGYTLFHLGGNTLFVTFAASFFRQIFLVDTVFVSLAFMGASSISIVGSLIGGRLVNRFGRKPLTVISVLLVGVLSILYLNVTNLWASIVLWTILGWFVGVAMTAYSSLAMEQAPAYRSTMMSLSSVSLFAGVAIGSPLGGALLLAFNYQILSLIGIFVIISSLLFYFFTIDPTRQAKQ